MHEDADFSMTLSAAEGEEKDSNGEKEDSNGKKQASGVHVQLAPGVTFILT